MRDACVAEQSHSRLRRPVSASSTAHRIDRAGMVVSLACAIHCAVMPIAIVALPVLLSIAGLERSAEHVIVVIAILLASVSAWQQARAGHWGVVAGFVAGAIILLASRFAGHARAGELVAITGSLTVAFSHARALSMGRRAVQPS